MAVEAKRHNPTRASWLPDDWPEAWRAGLARLRYEYLLARRSRTGLTLLALACLGGVIAGLGAGLGPSVVTYRAWRLGSMALCFGALPLMAVAARLNALALAADGVESRPRPAAGRFLLRYAGAAGYVLTVYAVLVIAAWLTQLVSGGPPPEGAGGRFSLGAPLAAFVHGVMPLLFLSAMAYCMTTLAPNLLSVTIVGLYWFLVLMGRDYLSRVFDFSLSQNALLSALLALGVLLLTTQVVHWRARVGRLWRAGLVWPAVGLLLAGFGLSRHLVVVRHDPPFHSKPIALAMGGQTIRDGFLPGFWLPDQRGRRTGLHDLGEGPFLVGLWSPFVPQSVTVLAHLQRLHTEYGPRGLKVVAICLADDWSVARRFARERGYQFPMLTDTACHWSGMPDTSAPLAEAYEAGELPAVYLGDTQRRLRHHQTARPILPNWTELEKAVTDLLAETAKRGMPGG